MVDQERKSRTGHPCPTPDKQRHSNQYQAQRAMRRLKAKFGDPPGVLHEFLCDCGYWHLGRRNRTKARRTHDPAEE